MLQVAPFIEGEPLGESEAGCGESAMCVPRLWADGCLSDSAEDAELPLRSTVMTASEFLTSMLSTAAAQNGGSPCSLGKGRYSNAYLAAGGLHNAAYHWRAEPFR